jgi:hypothetical protein
MTDETWNDIERSLLGQSPDVRLGVPDHLGAQLLLHAAVQRVKSARSEQEALYLLSRVVGPFGIQIVCGVISRDEVVGYLAEAAFPWDIRVGTVLSLVRASAKKAQAALAAERKRSGGATCD